MSTKQEIAEARSTIIAEIRRLAGELRELNAVAGEHEQTNFTICIMEHVGEPEHHRTSIDVSCQDDHHLLDLVAGVMGVWARNTHDKDWPRLFGV